MRIIRFVDDTGATRYGLESNKDQIEVLEGELFEGLQPSGKKVTATKILAPLTPTNIFCIGLNYMEHAKETGAKLPENPVIFMKPTSTVTGPNSDIILPASCTRGPEVDYESELAVVIGKSARNVSVENALDYVLGYTCANDISARKWQKHGGGGQWIRGKSFDTFCPLGPALVTADEIPNPQTLSVKTWLNGECMQDGNTVDMIFPVAELISRISQDTTLLPGTIILTGTPSGVGFARKPPVYLSSDDEVVVELSDIGRLVNTVRNA